MNIYNYITMSCHFVVDIMRVVSDISMSYLHCKTNVSKAQCTLDIDGLVQDCSISIANDPEILQSCTKPMINL